MKSPSCVFGSLLEMSETLAVLDEMSCVCVCVRVMVAGSA